MGFLLRLFWRLALLLAVYQLTRIAFFVVNMQQFDGEPGLARSFLHGFRFDICAIVLVNSVYCIVVLLGLERRLPKTIRWLYVIPNSIFVLLNFVDVEYFQFTGSRLTLNSFAISQDIGQQAGQLILYYWPIGLAGILCVWILFRLHSNANLFSFADARRPSWQYDAMSRLVMFALLVLAARGGMQAKPLAVGHAFLYSGANYLPLTLNSTFTILKSHRSNDLQRLDEYHTWSELTEGLATNREDPQYDLKTNVVVIILESFGREYMGYRLDGEGYTPFLDELAEKGSFFETAFVNGRRSIDALPSILAGIPSLMVSPLATSTYQTRDFMGLPTMLRDNGYSSAFFHGGHDGTMFFDIIAARLGFENYFGASAFPDQREDDGRWGIYDEPFLQWTAQQISGLKEPFFTTIFTLTSHHPYKIPPHYEETFAEGSLPIHRAIRYTDYSLRQFFATASTRPWYNNTLFVITADHSSKGENPDFERNIGLFRAPIVFFHPKQNPSFPNTNIPAQHVDIMPTLISLLGVKSFPYARFGTSLLNEVAPRSVVLFNHPYYWLVDDPYLLQTTVQLEKFEVYNWRDDPTLTKPSTEFAEDEKKEMRRRLMRSLQYFHNGLIENKLNQ